MIYDTYASGEKQFYMSLKEQIMPVWKAIHKFQNCGPCEKCGKVNALDAHHSVAFLDLLREACSVLHIDYSKGVNKTGPVYSRDEYYCILGYLFEKHKELRPVGLCRKCHNIVHGKETVFEFRDKHAPVNIVLPVNQPEEEFIEINFYNYNKKIKFSKNEFYLCIIFTKHDIIKYGNQEMYLVNIDDLYTTGFKTL